MDETQKKESLLDKTVAKTKQSWDRIPLAAKVSGAVVGLFILSLGLGYALNMGGQRKSEGKQSKSASLARRLVRESQTNLAKAGRDPDPVAAYGQAVTAESYARICSEVFSEEEATKLTGTNIRELRFFAGEMVRDAEAKLSDRAVPRKRAEAFFPPN